VWSTVEGGRITGVANFTRCCLPDSWSDDVTQQCEGTIPDYSVYQHVGTLIYWTRDEIAMICLRVPFQNLLVTQKCLSGNCHMLGFEESSSWMRVSSSTAMINACRLATQTNRAARAYDTAFYVILHKWCERSVGADCVHFKTRSAQGTVSCCTGVRKSWKMGFSVLTDVYCQSSKSEREK
jgi:hypothetical protein